MATGLSGGDPEIADPANYRSRLVDRRDFVVNSAGATRIRGLNQQVDLGGLETGDGEIEVDVEIR